MLWKQSHMMTSLEHGRQIIRSKNTNHAAVIFSSTSISGKTTLRGVKFKTNLLMHNIRCWYLNDLFNWSFQPYWWKSSSRRPYTDLNRSVAIYVLLWIICCVLKGPTVPLGLAMWGRWAPYSEQTSLAAMTAMGTTHAILNSIVNV